MDKESDRIKKLQEDIKDNGEKKLGRPRKYPKVDKPVQKKKAGRPKMTEAEKIEAKRKREELIIQAENQPKRKPGRPKKGEEKPLIAAPKRKRKQKTKARNKVPEVTMDMRIKPEEIKRSPIKWIDEAITSYDKDFDFDISFVDKSLFVGPAIVKEEKWKYIKALFMNYGLRGLTKKKLNLSNTWFDYSTHPKGKYYDIYFLKCIDTVNEIILDKLEWFLYDKVLSGEKIINESSLHFLLKSKAKKRGYVERIENANLEITPLTLNYIKRDDEENE